VVQGDALYFRDGLARHDQQAAHAPLRGNGQIGQDHKIVDALEFNRRNDGNIGVPIAQIIRTTRRNGKREVVLTFQRAVREPIYQRRGVQILDDGYAEFFRQWRVLAGNSV
jgi:hypothetical protein